MIDYDETIEEIREWQERETVLQVFEKGYSDNHTASDSAVFDAAEKFSNAITLLQHYREGLETIMDSGPSYHPSVEHARKTLEGPE